MRTLISAIVFALLSGAVPSQASPIAGGCAIFPPDDIWNTRVDQLPVDRNSTSWIAAIGAEDSLHPDFGSGMTDGGPIGIPFSLVPMGQPKVPINFAAFEGEPPAPDESDSGPFPIPSDAIIEGGPASSGDRHTLVVQQGSCTLYELYKAVPQTNGSWNAASAAKFDLETGELRTEGWTSADAAGLAIFPGLVRGEEVDAGAIEHAIRFTAPRTGPSYVWPARHSASLTGDNSLPPMGQRFRLKADFNISGFSADNQVILKALKAYGMILADNGSAWFISGAPDERWDNDDLHNLSQLQGSDFEAVATSALMVTPDSGKARLPN